MYLVLTKNVPGTDKRFVSTDKRFVSTDKEYRFLVLSDNVPVPVSGTYNLCSETDRECTGTPLLITYIPVLTKNRHLYHEPRVPETVLSATLTKT